MKRQPIQRTFPGRSTSSSAHRALCVVWVLLGTVLGCNAAGNLPTAPTEGVVFLDGEPLADADVTFTPQKGRPATARTNDKGAFQLTTYRPGDGAIVGEHVVTVNKQVPKSGSSAGGYVEYESLVAKEYSDPAVSPLRVEIPKDGDKNVLLNVAR